ncbi:hypothetical protein M409DRAFT_18753 [Zasmidium cellare ATCC 36951]|uniref:BTB domain-containing protein n=1 Tax=Zasmidium cellare ATCC 36951 TaxID=1080233 RepID=A0A6A6CY93_ZASCE|nr:uncharacterized protein M409DRAFT_18753 [Zasmidium cellare ATCC 36951]KAF2170779.1 hypothetical protein M409DRAFT_18753 [Zasmidium cellare ATCC 36951]
MAAPMARKRTHDYHTQHLVPLKIGPETTLIWLYPSILTTNSKFFLKALSEPWRATQTNALTLPGVDLTIFNHYINWCHLGDLDLVLEKLPVDASNEACTQRFHILTHIFVLADQLDDKVLRNACMDSVLGLAAETGWRPGDTTIMLAFSALPETSTLCSLPEAYLEVLLFGWARASTERDVARENPVDVGRCVYHEHDEHVGKGESCLKDEVAKSVGGKTTGVKTTPKRKRL